MIHYIAKFSYNFFWLPMKLIYLFFCRIKYEGQENLKGLKGPLIVVCNHTSWMDSFLVGTGFPFMSKLFPIRFACWHKWFYKPQLMPLILMFGGFPIKKGIELDEALKIPLRILRKGGVVGIFPEGKRRRAGRPRRGRKGPAYLGYMTGADFLPIKLEGSANMSFTKFFTRQYSVKVKIGKAFSVSFPEIKDPEDLHRPAVYIMEKIREI